VNTKSATVKYFTRERFDANQDDTPEAELDWNKAVDDYASHLERIRGQLPEGSRDLWELTLHDGSVERVERPSAESVRIVIDATRNPWGPRGKFELVFEGVNPATLVEPVLKDGWLYEELHISDRGFAFHVLFDRSEMIIEAQRAKVRSL
jgi:hypothetical protein